MTNEDVADGLEEQLAAIQTRIAANLELVPVAAWGFDERALELVRARKHALVNKEVGAAGRKLKKTQKQRIAQNLGGVPRTVGEVFGLLAASSLAGRLRRGPTAPKRPPARPAAPEAPPPADAKENAGPALEDWKLALLRQKGVGRRPVGKRQREDPNEQPAEVPPKKQKQHKPLTAAEREARKEKRKQSRQQKAGQQKAQKNADAKTPPPPKPQKPEDKAEEPPALAFSKLDFVLKPDEPKRKRDRLAGRDYAALLQKAQKRQAHVAEVRAQDPERADRLQQNIRFETALKRAQGEKDDVEKLARAVKRKAKTKEKRRAQWGQRVRKVDEDQRKRQETRTENIAKRREQKVKKKLERARKKGRLV
ncbi:Surfeit locus protein 6 containing protein [Aphelenchoides fujianensis]|nr:Surfeit locus protein 6 containing protein [Aphelenchoides fujianensis]